MGQWFWDVEGNKVVFNNKKVTNLGYEVSEIPESVGYEFFTDKIHPDDYNNVMKNMKDHLDNLTDAYEVEYRIRTKDGQYLWYYDRAIVSKRDENGQPIVLSGFVFDITEKKEQEEQLKIANTRLERMATIDELTGAYNRRYLLEKLTIEIALFKRYGTNFSIIMLDIDHFKHVNDNFGHNAGDLVLKELAKLIIGRKRITDIFCRWGGEEFIIILPETITCNAVVLAEDLRVKLSNMNIDPVGKVSASFGVSMFEKDDTPKTIISKVDKLMYEAKESGRNQVKWK